ncbi:MAG: inositol monophosphatase [Gammaproteobacteria bacterium]|nr:inositol monophosphatase [Gammaproteobacteria bacterium]MDH5628586.1 inositol monophosphatase [Gammaproteobacteria bacterium]
MQAFLTIAVRAVRKAGSFVIREWDKIRTIESKSKNDYVTNIDVLAEQLIIDTISHSYSDHAFLGEESGVSGESEYQWIIDPIDGTTNFIHKVPHWAISIACRYRGKTEIGVVYDPVREELFTAIRGRGAQHNDRRIRVSATNDIENSILATGFPFRNEQQLDEYLKIFKTLYPHCSDMRRAGSAALDLAYVAAGRYDGFWEYGLSDWDTAAGALLVTEAGGMVADMQGNPDFQNRHSIIAANPKIFKSMLQLINKK